MEVEVNSFNNGKLIKNPRYLFTIEGYPMQYGSMDASYDHLDWLHYQVAGSITKQHARDSPTVTITMDFYDMEGMRQKAVYVGKPGQWVKKQ